MCAMPLSQPSLCGSCLKHPPEQSLTISLYLYAWPIDRLISAMKYHDQLLLCDYFADQMYERVKQGPLPDMLFAIPLHPKRIKHRGYNQSFEIAKRLAKRLNIPLDNHRFIRIRDTVPQAQLSLKERHRNVSRAFQVISTDMPDHIALIDDVITTGKTTEVACKALKKAGAKQIQLWTIARAIRHD